MNNKNLLGYACINTTLRETEDVWTNRSLIKRTFKEKGLEYVSSLVLKNSEDLKRIIQWNYENDIHFFRMSSNVFPFIDWYEFEDLPDFDQIKANLEVAGRTAIKYGQRITQHPDHFVKLASPNNPELVNKSIKTLEQQAKVFDIMGLEQSHYNAINIHIGGKYGDKEKTAQRFINTFNRLSDNVKSRLTVENDDKINMYTVEELYEMIYKKSNIPIVFDSLHFICNPGQQSYQEALTMAVSTWPEGVSPVVHHSNSRKLYEDGDSKINAHTDYYYDHFQDFGHQLAIMLECKAKEVGLQSYKKLKSI